MKEAMRKGLISLITGSALVASPMAFAAQDNAGMHYTSASEGFYASIRTRYTSGSGLEDSGADVGDSFTRIGVQGTNDLGGGMEGFYRYEMAVGADNGDGLTTRLRYVGLRGGFGEISVGTQWDDTYNYVTSKTDLAQHDSGTFAWTFRANNSIQYNTPDLNGFKASLRAILDNNGEDSNCTVVEASRIVIPNEDEDDGEYESAEDCEGAGESKTVTEDDNDLDSWALSAQYNVQGFNVAATYETIADGLGAESWVTDLGNNNAPAGSGADDGDTIVSIDKDDLERWAIGASYGQDNWSVASWYGIAQARSVTDYDTAGSDDDVPGVINEEDEEIFSLAAQVSVDKVKVYGVYDSKDNVDGVEGVKSTQGIVGVQYNIGSQSRVWVEYLTQDKDASESEDDFVSIGLRHDF